MYQLLFTLEVLTNICYWLFNVPGYWCALCLAFSLVSGYLRYGCPFYQTGSSSKILALFPSQVLCTGRSWAWGGGWRSLLVLFLWLTYIAYLLMPRLCMLGSHLWFEKLATVTF